MAGVNKVLLIGRLGKDPEVKSLPGGQQVANFSIATSEKFTDKSGVSQEKTEWHNIVLWGKLADLAGKYIKKGSQVYIEGKLTTRSWDKDGVKQYRTEIVGQQMTFLDSKGAGDGHGASGNSGPSTAPTSGPDYGDEGGVPF